jgi:RNA recognition motif-containing protein
MDIYVGNLSYQFTDEELHAMFAEYGEVTSAKIVKDRFSGQSKGFGFVEMTVQADAENAIKKLDGFALKGRNLKVNQARPRDDNRARRPKRF